MSAHATIVTGGAGFIGSHLVERLAGEGAAVRILDNLSVGRRANVNHMLEGSRTSLHHVDVADADAIRPLFENVDTVYHLAALADIVPSIEKPEAYYRSNVAGTFAVLEAARAAGVRRFVYAASSSCYGIPETYPTPESAAIRPQYPYALTKTLGEQLVLHWGQVYGLPVISLRFFNVFGPRARTSGTYGAVFGVFLAQKLAGKPFTVVGDGTQTRDFTFVSDVVDALVSAARSGVSGAIINIGSGGTYSVNRLVELLGGEVVHVPKRPGEPDCTFADIRKARELLGWQPRVAFEDGVKVMVEHLEEWRDAPVWDPASVAAATSGWFRFLGSAPAAPAAIAP